MPAKRENQRGPALEMMDVFAVADQTQEVFASTEAGKPVRTTKKRKGPPSPDQRIGTGYRLSDGSIGVQLTAIPRNGKFVVRSAKTRRPERGKPSRR